MKNKKGYLLYEMLLSFTFTFIIILNIFTVITNLSVKLANVYQKNTIYSKQLSIYRKIGDDFMKYNILSIINCNSVPGEKCVQITYDGEPDIIRTLKVNETSKYIEYNNIKYVFDKANIGSPVLGTSLMSYAYPYNMIISLNIPIEYKKKTYDINIFSTNLIDQEEDDTDNNFFTV